MRRPTLVVLALTLAAATGCEGGGPTPTASDPGGFGDVTVRRTGTANSTATGVVRFTFGSSTANLSFIVSNNGSSVTTGSALYRTSAGGGVVMFINVTCLYVSGGQAWMSGTIVDSNDSFIEGFDASFKVVDGVPDQASLVNLAAANEGPVCNTAPEIDTANISAGLVIVS